MIIIIKPKLKNLLALLLIVSIAANLYLLFIKQDFDHQMLNQNQSHLRSISVYAENLVDNAETFILHSKSEQTENVREMLFDSWRVVVGEQRSISHHLVSIQPRYMGELEPKWSLIQYSLFRVDMLLHSLTLKFLEQGSYTVDAEELKKLKAAVTIFKKIYEAVERASDHPELVIDELTELMLLIDPHYSFALKNLGGLLK